jgi:hypothetical protein
MSNRNKGKYQSVNSSLERNQEKPDDCLRELDAFEVRIAGKFDDIEQAHKEYLESANRNHEIYSDIDKAIM